MKKIFDELSAEFSKTVTKRYSTSFSLGIYFLNEKLRQPIYSIYGFVRLADEIVDSFHDFDKPVLLSKFKRDCFEAIEEGVSLNPVLHSFQQVVNNYNIDHELIKLFLQSMEMDLSHQTYNVQKYDQYILGSAQVVGLMCLKVFINGDKNEYERLKDSAMKLGSAFQKVNFLRDANADYTILNRNYFPNVDLSKFSENEKRQIELEIEEDFSHALFGIRQLPTSSRRGVHLAYEYYIQLFRKIKKSSANKIMSERIRISNAHKFGLMFSCMISFRTRRI